VVINPCASADKAILPPGPVTGLESGCSMRPQSFFHLLGQVLIEELDRPFCILINIDGRDLPDS
jgi:hypothetical protein